MINLSDDEQEPEGEPVRVGEVLEEVMENIRLRVAAKRGDPDWGKSTDESSANPSARG